jgi:hypothetical protein
MPPSVETVVAEKSTESRSLPLAALARAAMPVASVRRYELWA